MKRDFDLIRSILLQVEAAPAGTYLQEVKRDDWIDGSTVAQHVALMAEYGLIEAKVASISQGRFAIGKMTWEGHDFLDAARNDTVWNKTKEHLAKVGGSASLEIVKAVLLQITRSQLGLP
jgi:hypothetical protein